MYAYEGSGVDRLAPLPSCVKRGDSVFEQARERILAALEVAAEAHGADIVDVEVVGTAKAPTVRVRVDHADPELPAISLDEVGAHSRWIGEVLDFVDPFPGTYTMEVSSPGLARPLRRRQDFERFAGQTVSVALVPGEGRRKYTGVLVGMEGDDVVLDCDGERHALPFEQLRSAKLKPSFDEIGK